MEERWRAPEADLAFCFLPQRPRCRVLVVLPSALAESQFLWSWTFRETKSLREPSGVPSANYPNISQRFLSPRKRFPGHKKYLGYFCAREFLFDVGGVKITPTKVAFRWTLVPGWLFSRAVVAPVEWSVFFPSPSWIRPNSINYRRRGGKFCERKEKEEIRQQIRLRWAGCFASKIFITMLFILTLSLRMRREWNLFDKKDLHLYFIN